MTLLTLPQVSGSSDVAVIREIARKRELGAFYTPLEITKVLCNWAIKSSEDVVLEPSFGGCTFLEASVRRLHELGEVKAKNLFGCDIDPSAFEHLRKRVHGISPANFHLGDFLQWSPSGADQKCFDVVIGNPPYVRYSNLPTEQRASVDRWLKLHSGSASRRASLWLFFTMHALGFLRKGGRIAWVLPTSFMTAQYASSLRSKIFQDFRRVAVVTLTERIFLNEGTEERTLILLAEGYQETEHGVSNVTTCLENTLEVKEFVDKWSSEVFIEGQGASHGMIPGPASALLASLEHDAQVTSVGNIADIQIGVVSGNAKFFIKSAEDWRSAGVEKTHLSYIVPRSRWLEGLALTSADQKSHELSGIPCLALDSPKVPRSESLLRYLGTYPKKQVKTNATFKKRGSWYRFLDEQQPDAFFVFMTHLGPRLVLNTSKANCTNSLYRVNLRHGHKRNAKLLAITLQTTFTQLAAERVGRALGSGALKLDPNEAKRLPVILPLKSDAEVREAFNRVDELLRRGDTEGARRESDKFIFDDSPRFKSAIPLLEESLEIARRRRMRSNHERGSTHG